MYSLIVLWLFILRVITALFGFTAIISGIISFAFSTTWLINEGIEAEKERLLTKRAIKIMKIFVPMFVITLLLTIIVPSKEEFLLFISMRALDNYNSVNSASSLVPETLIQGADNMVKVIHEATNAVSNFLVEIK